MVRPVRVAVRKEKKLRLTSVLRVKPVRVSTIITQRKVQELARHVKLGQGHIRAEHKSAR